MPQVLCFDCGGTFEVDYDTPKPTQQCPKCKDIWATQETFE